MSPPEEPAPSHATALPLTMSSAMASVARYHEYLLSFVQPCLGQRALEVGVGFGQYTRRMLAERRCVLGCDLVAGHLDELASAVLRSLLRGAFPAD
jgi:hypothetical protein